MFSKHSHRTKRPAQTVEKRHREPTNSAKRGSELRAQASKRLLRDVGRRDRGETSSGNGRRGGGGLGFGSVERPLWSTGVAEWPRGLGAGWPGEEEGVWSNEPRETMHVRIRGRKVPVVRKGIGNFVHSPNEMGNLSHCGWDGGRCAPRKTHREGRGFYLKVYTCRWLQPTHRVLGGMPNSTYPAGPTHPPPGS